MGMKKKTAKAAAKTAAKKQAGKPGSRAAQALALRRKGMTFSQIAKAMKYGGQFPASASYTMVKNGLRRFHKGDEKKIAKELEAMTLKASRGKIRAK